MVDAVGSDVCDGVEFSPSERILDASELTVDLVLRAERREPVRQNINTSAAAIGARRLILESPLTGHSVRANSAQAKSTRTCQSDAFRNDRKECGR
jgi:hypothetical protein